MKTSWKIATISKIPVRLHISMALVPFLFSSFLTDSPLLGLVAIALLFGSVLAHELGHALVARRYGIRVENITLTPIGGIAFLKTLPTRPGTEIAIALAGPAVSLAIAGGAYLLAPPLIQLVGQSAESTSFFKAIAYWLFYSNLFLGLFNLLPALPMDGGRVLRGLLAKRHGHLKATMIACKISRTLAAVGFVVGLFQLQFTWMAIAGFVYLVSRSEEYMARMRAAAQTQSPFGGSPFAGSPFDVHRAPVDGPSVGPQPNPDGPQGRGRPAGDIWASNQHPRQAPPIVVNGGRAEVIRRNDPNNQKS